MNDFLIKQKRFKFLRNFSLVFSAVLIFIYIGAEPYIEKYCGNTLPFQLTLFVLVLISMAFLFLYESKYSKAVGFIDDLKAEIDDCGYYETARDERESDAYIESVSNDLAEHGFRIENSTEVNSFSFDFSAIKGKEYLYLTALDTPDKNDVIAYVDSARQDLMQNKMRYKGNCAVVFICNKADESAIALSKSITKTFSGKRVLNTGIAIVELSSGRVYFRGNQPSVIQKLIAEYVMDCSLPIKEEHKGNEKLAFQSELERKLKDFNINDFSKGNYYER